jgi:KaiC/GvpD/RAD55 family RecA-like ATPase
MASAPAAPNPAPNPAGETVATGIDALDTFLRGGLPRGFLTLMLAPAGSGAEIFAKQFAGGAPGRHSVYVTTDESADEVQAAAKAGGWDFSGVQLVDLQTDFADRMMDAQQAARDGGPARRRFDARELVEGTHSRDLLGRAGTAPAPGSRGNYLERLLEPFTRARAPDRMVVHSLDFFLNLHTIEEVVSAVTALKASNARSGGLLLLVLAKGAHGATVERRLELLADCLIELEVTRKGTTFERFFMVRKVKNRSHGIGVSTYEVTPAGLLLETLERIV